MKLIIHTDGGARGNPGPAGAGAVIETEQGKVLKEISEYLGETTNNVAEYSALLRALQGALELFGEGLKEMSVEVYMDSELIVRQMNGIYKVKESKLKDMFNAVNALRAETMPNLSFMHIPRAKNSHADRLVNAAIDAAVSHPVGRP